MKTQKIYTIRLTKRFKTTEITGTLEYLVDYFNWMLNRGYDRDCTIDTEPKNFIVLKSHLKRSYKIHEYGNSPGGWRTTVS